MRHCTVSAPIESCNVSDLSSPTLRFCSLHLLHGKVLYFVVEPKSKTKELYNQTCAYLAFQGMLDTDIFGLTVILDGEYLFVDPDYKLSKYAPKNWRSSSTHGLDNSGKPLLAFYFRVQFYIDSPLLLRDDTSRHHYYLQLRHNITNRNFVLSNVSEEIIFMLVGLALQADYGDYSESIYAEYYFPLQEYFPQEMVTRANETQLYQKATIMHKANRTLPKAQAETQFIREASSRDTFSLAHNSHLYRLKQKKHEQNPGTIWLAICTRGIELYEEKLNKPISGTFLWNNIGKLCFDRKKFEIRSLNSSSERMIYYTNSDEKSKHLLTLCRLTHQFCMAIQPRLNELSRREEEEKKQYHDWGAELSMKLTDVCCNHNVDQRISVISSTSSNTTSGIVSDRVHSLDESEDDLDMEIMINSPPAVSIESLALAHLRDSFHKDSKIKNAIKIPYDSSAAYCSTIETQDENFNSSSLSKLTLPVTPAPTDGSQCSSSCSTVVVSGYSHEKIKPQCRENTVLRTNRRHSTSSSLELGYSHTAQNSALSDSASCCLDLDFSIQSAHTSSGIYTLQSSCETNTVATTAAAASSETSGICVSVAEDSEGARSRSGSIVSASGSFHGDGSDPSDTGHGTPLTAEELSDLIVGRSPKPCRGKYPSVATVSESLDSIADYVTLPPPPIPPPCCISSKANEIIPPNTRIQHTLPFTSKECLNYETKTNYLSNTLRTSNKYYKEEAMLQSQIQFQHLAAGFSSHLLMNALPNPPKPVNACAPNTDAIELKDPLAFCNPEYSTSAYNSVTNNMHVHDKNQISHGLLPMRMEEANVRIISSKPQINLLTAQSVPSGSLAPSYATPTTKMSSTQSFNPSHTPKYYSECNDLSIRNDYCNNSVPIVGSNNYLDFRRSGAAFLQQIHEKFPPPPPLLYSRQPPPPPPPPRNHYSGYNNALPNQFDQYRLQLYSDVDYVMYPMKDPAISKQEYLDSKEAAFHCNQYLSQNSLNSKCYHPCNMFSPTVYSLYDKKSLATYRSTPNVAVASGYIPKPHYPYSNNSRYASNQNLNSELSSFLNSSLAYLSPKYSSSASPLYSGAASLYSSSMQSLRRDSSVYGKIVPPPFPNCNFTRSHSHDNILNNYCPNDKKAECNFDGKFRKPPPPPPPVPPPPLSYSKQNTVSYFVENKKNAVDVCPNASISETTNTKNNSVSKKISTRFNQQNDENISLDIRSLREESKKLDLPLISALCNDKSLLRQTNTIDLCNEEFSQQRNNWLNDLTNRSNVAAKSKPNVSDKGTLTDTQQNKNEFNKLTKSAMLRKSVLDSVKSVKNNSIICAKNVDLKHDIRDTSNKKIDSFVPNNINGHSSTFSSIADHSKHLKNNVFAESSKSFSSVNPKYLCSKTVSSVTKIKSNLDTTNVKIPKSTSSTNKLKYHVSQPIKYAVKKKSTLVDNSETNKTKCKPFKSKINDLKINNSNNTKTKKEE